MITVKNLREIISASSAASPVSNRSRGVRASFARVDNDYVVAADTSDNRCAERLILPTDQDTCLESAVL